MSDTSTRLALPYLAEAQAQKHVTVNESLRRLDALVQLSVRSASVDAEPASPSESEGYIMTAAATGPSWGGFAEGDIVIFQDGAWAAFSAIPGMVAYVEDEGVLMTFSGSAWRSVGELPSLGVNTAPDNTNKMAVKSDAVLLSHDDVTPGTGDMRVVINKAAGTNTASFVFQSAFSGKAEFGLTGTDDFVIKVADDGGTFRDAIVIDRQTGAVSFPNTA